MAKKFFYVCAGICLLALSYHLGASTATAQASGNTVTASPSTNMVITANGDVYFCFTSPQSGGAWNLVGNVFGGAVPTKQSSWGALKVNGR